MLSDEDKKSALDELMKDGDASFIDIKPPQDEPEPEPVDMNALFKKEWAGKSQDLLDAYKFGKAIAAYGDNELSTVNFFNRLSLALKSTISNEFQKNNIGSESLKQHFDILDSCLKLIAKEIDAKELKDYQVSSIIASLQAFITNYTIRRDQ